MASTFFDSFMPLALQSAAQAGPAAMQGTIQGQDLALDRQMKQAQIQQAEAQAAFQRAHAQHYGHLQKLSPEMQRLQLLQSENPMLYLEVMQHPEKYPHLFGSAASARMNQEKKFVPIGSGGLYDVEQGRTIEPIPKPASASTTTDQRNALAMGMSLDQYYTYKQGMSQKGKLDPDAKLSKETVTFMAEQLLAGDTSVLQNLGRGMQGGRNVTAVREETQRLAKERGITPPNVALATGEFQGLKAAERSLGTRTANFGMAKSEAYSMADIVLQTSDAFDRSEFPGVNRAIQFFEKNTGDVKVRQFGAAINSFINAYSRAISPTGVPTVSDKDHAREILSTADSKEQVKGLIDILKQEMDAAGKAPGIVKEELRQGFSGQPTKKFPAVGEKPKMPVPSKSESNGSGKGTAYEWYKSLPADTQSVMNTYYKNWKSGTVSDEQFRNDALSILGDFPETRGYVDKLMALKQKK